jgi:hypothetical protein
MEVAAAFDSNISAIFLATVSAGGSPWLDLIKNGHLDLVNAESTVHVAPVLWA